MKELRDYYAWETLGGGGEHRWSEQTNRELKWNTKYKNIETEVKGINFFP